MIIAHKANQYVSRTERICRKDCPLFFGISARTWMLILGVIAGSLTTFSLIPQLLKSFDDWQNNVALDNLSLERYIIHLIGMVVWLLYGLLVLFTYGWKPAFPLLFFNIITTTTLVIMIIMIQS